MKKQKQQLFSKRISKKQHLTQKSIHFSGDLSHFLKQALPLALF